MGDNYFSECAQCRT